MTRLKNAIYGLLTFALLSLATSGCLSVAAQNSVRVDEGITEVYELTGGGTSMAQKWVLPEKRSISRIHIYFDPTEPLRNVTVHARVGEDSWRRVKAITNPVRTSPYVIKTAISTDAIRIILSSSTTLLIRRIELYGTASDTTTE